MSYIVTLRNRQTYQLSDERAWKLKDALQTAKGTIMVDLNDDMIRSSEITTITKQQLTQADIPVTDSTHQLNTGCRGQYSIQAQINQIARDEGRTNWPKLIQDEAWHERTRQRLRHMSEGPWCDYQAAECGCEAGYSGQQADLLY